VHIFYALYTQFQLNINIILTIFQQSIAKSEKNLLYLIIKDSKK